LSEEIKITLKVSQNLHAGMGPYFLGLFVAKNVKDPLSAASRLSKRFLPMRSLIFPAPRKATARAATGPISSARISCATIWRIGKPGRTSPSFLMRCPFLEKDGTLAKIQKDNPGAGHVFAKTGTFAAEDKLNSRLTLNGKGLAGYVQTKSGKTLAFAAYVNHTSMPADPDSAKKSPASTRRNRRCRL